MLATADIAPQSAIVIQSEQAAEKVAWLSVHAPRRHASPPKKRRTISVTVRPASLPVAWTTAWLGYPQAVVRFATCVAHHESWSAGLWRARNRTSTASGFAQWLDGTWRANAARTGVLGYSRAFLAPPRDQVAVFAWMFAHHEQGAWSGSHCGYGT